MSFTVFTSIGVLFGREKINCAFPHIANIDLILEEADSSQMIRGATTRLFICAFCFSHSTAVLDGGAKQESVLGCLMSIPDIRR